MLDHGSILLQFGRALEARDIIPPRHLIADGRLHRCDAAGRNGKGDAAYVMHLDDFPAGGFQNHRDGLGWQDWCLNTARDLTLAERAELKRRMANARGQRDEDERKRHAAAADRAKRLLADMPTCPDEHPYLRTKQVRAHGIALYHDRVVVPVRDILGRLMSLQFIDDVGGKRFLTGARSRAAATSSACSTAH